MHKIELIYILEQKIKSQGGVPTFFDNLIQNFVVKNTYNNTDHAIAGVKKLFENLMKSRSERFSLYQNRQKELCDYSKKRTSLDDFTFLMSQGTHSTIKWKGLDVYKTAFDMVIYMQLLSEIKPDIIIEYGSGSGGSAVWLADIALSLDIDVTVLSYDIKKPKVEHPNIYFEEIDLIQNFPYIKNQKGKKLVIEDAHVNLEKVLLNTDSFLTKGDYLIVEDSAAKNKEILNFLSKSKKSYMVDNYYVDFFGKNSSCAVDSIFAVF